MQEIESAKIIGFIVELYVWLSIGFLGYLVRVQLSRTALADWLKATWHTLGISYILGALICVALVISPNASTALGQLGFNAEQGMFAIAFVLVGSTIGVTSLITPAEGGK